jgi:hypothetical protein
MSDREIFEGDKTMDDFFSKSSSKPQSSSWEGKELGSTPFSLSAACNIMIDTSNHK